MCRVFVVKLVTICIEILVLDVFVCEVKDSLAPVWKPVLDSRFGVRDGLCGFAVHATVVVWLSL